LPTLVYANERFKAALEARGEVCGMASEEEEDFVSFDSELSRHSKYVVLIDPLDGSSNIDVNVSVGTIFSIYRRVSKPGAGVTLEDFLQPGHRQVAAGYVVYGSSTMLVYTTGFGVNGFTYDPSIGCFCLSHENIRIPEEGKIYSINEGNYIYECNPMAFLVEQAGGKASDGFGRIMDIQPTALHQRTPYFVGSTRMVERAEAFMREFSAHEDPANQG